MDDKTIRRISKKYKKAGFKTWVTPTPSQLNFIRTVLEKNKEATLRQIANKTKSKSKSNTNSKEELLSKFIQSFVSRTVSRSKFPLLKANFNPNDALQNVLDEDHLKRYQKRLVESYNRELTLLDSLDSTLKDEKEELEDLENFYKSYLRAYEQEMKDYLGSNEDVTEQHLKFDRSSLYKEGKVIKGTISLNSSGKNNTQFRDIKLKDEIKNLTPKLNRINSKTERLGKLSKLLDESEI